MKRKSKITPEMEDKIWELKNKWYTQKQIADALGISQQSVQKKLDI